MPPDPKRWPRIKDPEAGKAKVEREGRCRVCGKVDAPAWNGGSLSRSHIVPRGQGGDDVDANIIPLCGDGVNGCHGKHEAYDWFVRSKERAGFTGDEIAYAIRRQGAGWFDRQYPRTPYEGGKR